MAKLASLVVFTGVILSGCNYGKCKVTCQLGILPAAVGYSLSNLDTVIINTYTPDNTFSHLVSSASISKYNTNAGTIHPSWWNPNTSDIASSSLDTTGDTLANYGSVPALVADNVPYDIEIIVPSNNNKVYRFSNFVISGNETEEQYCKENLPKPCSRYVASYTVNGTKVNFPASTYNYIYFQR